MRISDWSSDVCSSDRNEIALLEALARAASTALENGRLFASLEALNEQLERRVRERTAELDRSQEDRQSGVEGKGVSVGVDLGGRRIIKKNTTMIADRASRVTNQQN